MTGKIANRLRSFAACAKGATAVEFALMSPFLIAMIGGVVDIGGAIAVRGAMDSSLSASVHYTLSNADKVSVAGGGDLAGKALVVAVGGLDRKSGQAALAINGKTAASYAGGTVTVSQADPRFDQCFCPSVGEDGVSWGPQTACSFPCPQGGYAGKFVSIEMSQRANPLFKGVVAPDGLVSSRTMVQVQ